MKKAKVALARKLAVVMCQCRLNFPQNCRSKFPQVRAMRNQPAG